MKVENQTSRRKRVSTSLKEGSKKEVRKFENYCPNDAIKAVAGDNAIISPRELAETLVQQARDLQMLPDVAVQAIAIVDEPEASLKDLVDIIAQDIRLTTDILSLSNSSLFGFGQPVLNLQKAITRVGLRQTKNMILAASFNSMMKNMDWQEERVRNELAKHSFITGIIASHLNRLFRLGIQGEEFTAGLIHDVGRTLIAVSIPDAFNEFDPLTFDEQDNLLDHELNLIGTTHAEIGAWFLQRNHLPNELIDVARFHHNPQDATAFKRLISLISLADDMANFTQRDGDVEAYDPSELEAVKILEYLGVDDVSAKVKDSAVEIIESANEEVSQLLSF